MVIQDVGQRDSANENTPSIAFFDLDRTLISVNSARLWVASERRAGRLGTWSAVQALTYFGLYRLGYTGLDSAMAQAGAVVAGEPLAPFNARVTAFYEGQIRETIRRRVPEVLQRHRDRGDTLAILTASTLQLGEAVAQELGIDVVLANELLDDGSALTGELRQPLCFGEGKVARAAELAESLGVELSACTFYTDSASDLAALEAVGHPVCVDPDPRLARTARQRGWPVEHWD